LPPDSAFLDLPLTTQCTNDLLMGGLAAMALPAINTNAQASRYRGPVLDSHIHLFDPFRPQGIPWPEIDDVIYRRSLPDDYFAQAAALGIVGAIAVEASPWRQDNDWLLNAVRQHSGMVGFVGNLVPTDEQFAADLDRLAAEPLFLGIRYGNLWERDLAVDLETPGFIDGMRQLAQSGRVLDSANPTPSLVAALLKVSDAVPDLRIVVDHLPNAQIPAQQADRYWQDLRALAGRGNVFMKLSEVPRQEGPSVCLDLSYYQEQLDVLWELFGEDRALFGSDWPNSDHLVTLDKTIGLTREYLATKSHIAQEKVLYLNSKHAYHWHSPREDPS
jgi:L-fuconolactonase